MTNRNSGFIDPTILLLTVGAVVVIAGLAFGLPQYNVWSQSLAGKSELARAEYNRQIAIQEANAKKESAKALADAEVIRAEGVAKANQIIGDSLKGNNDYLSYLWITGLEEGNKNGNKTVYMIPTQGNIPAPVFNVNK
jgi:regulator of protease activity HflC (stomatin/prohibitin superfamily)